jgi:hypothetical protein
MTRILVLLALCLLQPAAANAQWFFISQSERETNQRLSEHLSKQEREKKQKEIREKELSRLATTLMQEDGKKDGLDKYKQLLIAVAVRYGESETEICSQITATVAKLKAIDDRYTCEIVMRLTANSQHRHASYPEVCRMLIYKVREASGK